MLETILSQPPVDPIELAARIPVKAIEKHDWMLSEDLLNIAFSARNLDVDAAYRTARDLVGEDSTGVQDS
jgi:hypothetical protein